MLGLHQALEEREKEPKENRRVGLHIPFLIILWASVSSLAGGASPSTQSSRKSTKGGTQLGRVQNAMAPLLYPNHYPTGWSSEVAVWDEGALES